MNIDKYKKDGYSNWQIEEIKQAFRDGLSTDVIERWIIKAYYGADQMREIRLGLKAGLDVSTYAKEGIASQEMRHIREKLLEKKDEENSAEVKEEKEQKRIEVKERRSKIHLNTAKSLLILVPSVVIIVLLVVLFVYGKDLFSMINSKAFIELSTDQITINVGDEIDPYAYIKSYSDGDNVNIFIDTTQLDAEKLGTSTAQLTVNVIDDEAPIINLRQDAITLEEGSNFICNDYYDVLDNYDDEIQSACSILDTNDIGDHDVTVSASDSSGNKSEKVIHVTISEKKPDVIYRDPPSNNSGNGNSSSNSGSQNNTTPDVPEYQEPSHNNSQGTVSSQPFISGQLSYSVPVGTSTSDFIFEVSSHITASSTITISFEEVNLGVEGTYPFVIRGADGASATGSVTVY